MSNSVSHFDQSAATWDNKPERIALAKAIGEAILREAQPTGNMDVLDYGCGTGMVSLFLLPHVHSMTGADNSPGMLDVLGKKIQDEGLTAMRVVKLDLENDPLPRDRYHMIVSSMVMHHVANLDQVLRSLHQLLLPNGVLCIADLDTEPGWFHDVQTVGSVPHHGFDRIAFQDRLRKIGFAEARGVTAHVLSKPIQTGEMRDFPVFLIVAKTTGLPLNRDVVEEDRQQ
jgi:ubiquinone/menaquinone biosynthesis C-methylase UbiE